MKTVIAVLTILLLSACVKWQTKPEHVFRW